MLSYRIIGVCTLLLIALGAGAAQCQPAAADVHGDPLPPGALARLGTVRFRHATNVVFASFLPDGKRVLSVSEDGVLCVWEFPSGKAIRRLETLDVAKAFVFDATLSPDGKHLIAFGDDGFMRTWDWANAKQTGKVASIGKMSKRSIQQSRYSYDTASGGPVYSPDHKTLMLFGACRVLHLVDLPSGKEIGPSLVHTDALISIAFTPDGRQILTKEDQATHTWNAETGKALGVLPLKLPATSGTPTVISLDGRPSTPLVISQDGRLGATMARLTTAAEERAAKEHEVVLFDTASGQRLSTIMLENDGTLVTRRLLLFSPDSKLLAASVVDAQQKINLYDVRSGKLVRTLDAGPVVQPAKVLGGFGGKGGGPGGGGFAFLSRAGKMLFSLDGKALAVQAGRGAKIAVLNTATGKQIASVNPGENSLPMQGAFSLDGRCLALAQSDGTVTLFELASGLPRGTYGSKLSTQLTDRDLLFDDFLIGGSARTRRSVASFAITPNAKLLAVSGPAGSVHVWDLLAGKESAVFKGHTVAVNALEFAPDGKTLASASNDTTALIWDMSKVVPPALSAKALQAGDLEKWWQALAQDDATGAFAAMREFAARPDDAVTWIKERIKPAAPLDSNRVQEVLKRLDDGQFKVRAKAAAELAQMDEQLLPLIAKALAANPSQEVRRRLEETQAKLSGIGLQGDRLRVVRAVETLELIGTPHARLVLQALAGGAPDALLTKSAQASLKR